MPFVRHVETLAPKLVRVLLPEFLASLPNHFIRHLDPAIQHHFLDIPIVQGERVIDPDTVANNFAGKSMTGIHVIGIVNGVGPVR